LQKIRNLSKLIVVVLLVFFTLGFSFHSEHGVFAQTDQITLELQAANSAVGQAFNSVLDAEKAGANVTQLLAKLNTAGAILADAQNELNSINTVNITTNLENAVQIANQVKADALDLRNVSLVESQNSFWLTLIFSVVGAIVFGVSLLFVWRRFKRSYTKKLLGSKPEVVDNTP
jgi:cell division protein FtsB